MLETAKQNTIKSKKEFEENSEKIQEKRTIQTKLDENEKNHTTTIETIKTKTEEKQKYQKIINDIQLDYTKCSKTDIKSKRVFRKKYKR